MKYFIKRDVGANLEAFEIYDEKGAEKYLVTLQEKAPDFRKDEVSSLLKSIEQN